MYRTAFAAALALVCAACFAQLQPMPRVMQTVADPNMVIDDRGSKLEVLSDKRATARLSNTGDRTVSVFKADKSSAITSQQLGVVFNHAMQATGYISGEIAFKMKGDLQATSGFDSGSYPGLAKLTTPNVYVVVARTATEFVDLTKRLQQRTDVEWVEPIVTY